MPLGHLGTVAKVRPQGKKTLEIDVDLGVSLLVDQGRAAVDGNTASFTVGAFAPTWPRSELPEFIPGQPVCESFAVKLEATPATVELTGVQVDLPIKPVNRGFERPIATSAITLPACRPPISSSPATVATSCDSRTD